MITEDTTFVNNETSRQNINDARIRWISRWWKRRKIQAAITQIYPDFAKRHPSWVHSLFDEHFLYHGGQLVIDGYNTGQAPRPPRQRSLFLDLYPKFWPDYDQN